MINKHFSNDPKDLEFFIQPYVNEIKVRYKWILEAFNNIGEAIESDKNSFDIIRFAVEVIGHAVVIHRIVTGTGALKSEKERVQERVNLLREKYTELNEIETPENLNLVRNHYEHFDARLDEWAISTENKMIIDMTVSPERIEFSSDMNDKENLRSLNPETEELIFWNEKVNLRDVVLWAQKVCRSVI